MTCTFYYALALLTQAPTIKTARGTVATNQSAPKERRRRRAEKRLSKRMFWKVRFFSAPLRFALKTPEMS